MKALTAFSRSSLGRGTHSMGHLSNVEKLSLVVSIMTITTSIEAAVSSSSQCMEVSGVDLLD